MRGHPLADLFPLMEGTDFDALVADIEANGQREPIMLFEDKILDGRNRWHACKKAGIEPKTKEYRGNDPLAYVISLNLKRRHLNESQRAIVAAKLAMLKHGGDRISEQAANLPVATQEQAATLLNVSERSVRSARAVLDKGTPELRRAVEQGHLAVSAAAQAVKFEPERQQQVAQEAESGAVDPLKAVAAKAAAERRERSRNAQPLVDGMELRIGDCREVLCDVPANSVSLIITDPPYGNEAEPLYHWLAGFAARVLIPGGSLICCIGNSRLDRDIAILSSGPLKYWWMLVRRHHLSRRFPGRFTIGNFRPIVWFVKEFRRGRTLMPDLLESPPPDKTPHGWAQGEGGVSQIIEHLTEPGELIVDPFAGTAMWGHIATNMGRRWLGADVVEGGAEVVETDPLDNGYEADDELSGAGPGDSARSLLCVP
jgi:ParB-like chromosome segregation protein Spo0J